MDFYHKYKKYNVKTLLVTNGSILEMKVRFNMM